MSRVMLTAALSGLLASAALAAEPAKKPAAPKATPTAAAPKAAPSTPAPATPAPAAPTAPAVVVKTIEPVHALVLPMKGSYEQHPEAFERLGGQLGTLGVSPVGPPFGRYFNSPGSVPDADLLWEIGFPVGTDVQVAAPFEVKDIPGGLAATLVHEGPPESIGEGMPKLVQWVTTNGYRPSGPITVVFLGQPGPEGMKVEFRIAVEKVK